MKTNLLADKKDIKKSLQSNILRILGRETSQMDPLVQLLVDAISYELSKVGQGLVASNNQILTRLTDILVKGDDKLARPPHGVIKVNPIRSNVTITPRNQFYIPNGLSAKTNEKIQGDIYFSPALPMSLFNGYTRWVISGNKAKFIDDYGQVENSITMSLGTILNDGCIWLGVESSEPGIQDDLSLFLTSNAKQVISNEVLSFRSLIKAELYSNEEFISLSSKKTIEEEDTQNFSENHVKRLERDVFSNYESRFVSYKKPNTFGLETQENRMSIPSILLDKFREEHIKLFNIPCFWIRLEFPPAFKRDIIRDLVPLLNCVPVMNRKLNKLPHSFSRSGTILPLDPPEGETFLGVESLSDKLGREYQPCPNPENVDDLQGSFLLNLDALDATDENKGLLLLQQVIHKIREEGNSFSSLGMDSLLKDLGEIQVLVDALEKKITRNQRSLGGIKKNYILVNPYEGTDWLSYEYWTTNAHLANGIGPEDSIQQYRADNLLESGNIIFITNSLGGRDVADENIRMNQLRKTILSKERLVSGKDIEQFVMADSGHLLKGVAIKDGVAISEHNKKGLIRTIDIILQPDIETRLDESEWEVLCGGLEKKLTDKMVVRQMVRVRKE